MRRLETRMNRRKKPWKISLFSHCKRQSRCMQHVRTEISEDRNEDCNRKEACAKRPDEMLCHIRGGSGRGRCMRECMNHDVLHGYIQGRGCHQGDQEGHGSISARITSFSGSDKG